MGTLFPTAPPAPAPAPEPTPQRPKVILWKWSLVATGIFFAYVFWACGSGLYQGSRLSNASVRHFHEEFNAGQYEEICQDADGGFSTSETHDEIIAFFTAVHRKLGNSISESRTYTSVNASPGGTTIVTTYTSTFEKGRADERFVWVKSGGALKLRGYHIESSALIIN